MSGLILDHLWQSTLFAAVVSLLTLALRRNSAQARYALWFVASMKFLIPFAALAAAGSYLLASLVPPVTAPDILLLKPVAQPFTENPFVASGAAAGAGTLVKTAYPALLMIWGVGCAWILARWLMQWSQLHRVVREAVDCPLAAPVPVKIATSRMEPGLVGIIRPVILLPQGISEQLTGAELTAVLAHEICHLRRRDNLVAGLHMLVETLFWFHPLIWWLGARLNEERERACDEQVLSDGQSPDIYAESILKVCQFYHHCPLDCAAGISGADLKSRMETIMENQMSLRLNAAKKLMLAAAAAIAIAAPVVAGLVASPAVLAQPATAPAPSSPDTAEQANLRRLLDGIASGNPTYNILTPTSASVLREQLAGSTQIARDLGPMTSLEFKETQRDFHIYTGTYQHGQANWIVGPHETGQLDIVIIDSIRIAGKPHPGAQEAASRYLAATQKGQPNYSDMTPAMASNERASAEKITALMKPWGALKAISYESTTLIGPAGGRKTSRFAPPETLDMFKVVFDNRSTELVIELAPDGKIAKCLVKGN